jgi:hypothetical protein
MPSLVEFGHFRFFRSHLRRVLAADEIPLHWVVSSKRDFLSFPAAVKEDVGNALGIAQFGGTAPTAKPWKGLGSGVLELVESHDGNSYRAVYTVRFEKPCTSCTRSRRSRRPASGPPSGMLISWPEDCLKDYEEHYGKPKH